MQEPSPVHQDQLTAERAFAFLHERGFALQDRFATAGTDLHDGWSLSYASPEVLLTVQYFDAQFEVKFSRDGFVVEYLVIDRELFSRRSGLHGNMFTPPDVAPIIEKVAADICDNYGSILSGDEEQWTRIRQSSEAPKRKARIP